MKLNYKHFIHDDETLFVKKVGKNVNYLVVYVKLSIDKWEQ